MSALSIETIARESWVPFKLQDENQHALNFAVYKIVRGVYYVSLHIEMIVITHSCGFFSNCSVRLHHIVEYFNKHKKLPETVDTSKSFRWYTSDSRDVTYDYFEPYNTDSIKYSRSIDYIHKKQYTPYNKLDYDGLSPFIRNYFTPTKEILNRVALIEEKYSIKNYDNISLLFYRGNDKVLETKLCTYEEIIQKAKTILLVAPDRQFLIQSDETEFIERMTSEFPKNSFYFKDEIRHMSKRRSTVDKVYKEGNSEYSKFYLAITLIMSKCKEIVFTSGNCSIWIMLYRGHSDNISQFLEDKWLC